MAGKLHAGTGDSTQTSGAPASALELVIETAESTGEGITEGLTLRVRGFPDSATLGTYLSQSGVRTVPSEPGAKQPAWWDLFYAGADAGIAYAPVDGISRIEIESSAALARAFPLATIDPSRDGAPSGHVTAKSAEIGELIGRYVTRHHRAEHEGSHVRRNSLFATVAVIAVIVLLAVINGQTGGALSKAAHAGAVRMGMVKEPIPAFVVKDAGSVVTAANVVGFGNVYLEFPERTVQGADTVAVKIPAIAAGDRVYTTIHPDSAGGVVQIIVSRILDARGRVRYEHPAGAFAVPSYKLLAPAEWGPVTSLATLGPGYVDVLEKRMDASKRIRVNGLLTRVSDASGDHYMVSADGQSVSFAGAIDGLTSARLQQFLNRSVDVGGNMMRVLPGAYQGTKPTGAPMLEMNPQAVLPLS